MTVILPSSCRSNQDDKEDTNTKPTRAEFLVSFLVDARGGSMTGSRSTQLRIVIPPRAAEQPVRITCRQLRSDNVLHLPPLNDGEGLASRILQLTPCKFLTPILVELKYCTHDTADREIVIYRCDAGKKWSLHTNCGSDENLNAFMSTSAYDISKVNPSDDFKIQITTTSLPRYFALVCRPKQQALELSVNGGAVHSSMAPGLSCTFPAKALTKAVNIGLSVVDGRPGLLDELETQGAAISPVFTIEPRRRKFHKPVTISLPVPHPKQVASNEDGAPIEMTLMLLCSMCESGSRSVWENVTESTPLTRTNGGSIQFNTVVSAAFWLVNLPKWMVEDSLPMLDRIFRNMCRVPYRARLAIFWRKEENNQNRHSENGHDEDFEASEASVRVLVYTQEDRGHDPNCLETQEGYKPLVGSADLVIYHGTNLDINIKGNLIKLQETSRLRFQPYHENRCTLSVRRIQTTISACGSIDISSEQDSLFSSSINLPIKN